MGTGFCGSLLTAKANACLHVVCIVYVLGFEERKLEYLGKPHANWLLEHNIDFTLEDYQHDAIVSIWTKIYE